MPATNLAEFTRRTTVGTFKRVIETASTAVSGGNDYLLQRQYRFVNQLLRKMQPLRMRNRERRRANVVRKQAPQMPAGHAEPLSQVFDTALFQLAVRNQPQTASDRGRSSAPCRRSGRAFRTAPQAGPESSFAGSRGTGVEFYVFAFWRVCRADRAAINSGGDHPNIKLAVKAGVSGQSGPFVYFVLLHAASIRCGLSETSRNRTCNYVLIFAYEMGEKPAAIRRQIRLPIDATHKHVFISPTSDCLRSDSD
jgi:hypothetical protein